MDENVAKAVIEQWASMEADHEPDGWPAVRMRDLTTIRAHLVELEAENGRLRGVVELVPANWIDPLLTGSNAVVGKPPYDCPAIERLLNAIRDRITAHLSENSR